MLSISDEIMILAMSDGKRGGTRLDLMAYEAVPGSEAGVLVIGAGPAGCTAAISLARLGHDVSMIAYPRGFEAYEGLAPRVASWLRAAGFAAALRVIPQPVKRRVEWDGSSVDRNAESIVRRSDFDRALLEDAEAAGVRILHDQVRRLPRAGLDDSGVVLASGRRLVARFFVDARGRAAHRAGDSRDGPVTVSIAQLWQGPARDPGTAVTACADGWVWLAREENGICFSQLNCAADVPGRPGVRGLAAWLRNRLESVPLACEWLDGCAPAAEPVARASTARLNLPLAPHGRVLRIGDCAMAVDPLSGSGLFQALSSAALAPAVINTLLRMPDSAALALNFYEDRLRHLFERFARTGRDFYRAETRWPAAPFWRERAAWPDEEIAHGMRRARAPEVALRAVVDDGLIRQARVVVTDDQPLGTWRVAGIEVAPLLDGLQATRETERAGALDRLLGQAGCNAQNASAVRRWFAGLQPF